MLLFTNNRATQSKIWQFLDKSSHNKYFRTINIQILICDDRAFRRYSCCFLPFLPNMIDPTSQKYVSWLTKTTWVSSRSAQNIKFRVNLPFYTIKLKIIFYLMKMKFYCQLNKIFVKIFALSDKIFNQIKNL